MDKIDVLTVFENRIDSMPGISSQKSYRKFLNLFSEFLNGKTITPDEISIDLSNDFVHWLVDCGYSQTYVNRIGQNFKSLYNTAAKEGLCPKRKDLFPWVKSSKGKPKKLNESDFPHMLQEINRRKFTDGSIHSRYRNLLNLSILLGGASLDIVSKLSAKDISHGRIDITWNKNKSRSFLATPKIAELINDLQTISKDNDFTSPYALPLDRMAGLLLASDKFVFNEGSLAEAAEATLRSLGLKGTLIKNYLLHPASSSSLTILDDNPVDQEQLDKVTIELEDFLFATRKRWYALRMTADYDVVEALIKESINDGEVTTFYPMEKVARKVRGKIKKTQAPVLKNILFIFSTKSKACELDTLLRGKAYFYRTSPDDLKSYSIIHDEDMRRFRELITSDCELTEIPNSRELEEGTQIDITGNVFHGKKAIVIRREKDGRYLVNVLGSNFRVVTTKISRTFIK